MVIPIIGGSGSGKDTQGKLLAAKLRLPHIVMGQILRDEEAAGNPVAIEAMKTVNTGKWASGEQTASLLKTYLEKHARNGCILNGFPRSVDQQRFLEPLLADIDQKIACVIHLTVPDDILLARMQKQRDEKAKEGQAQRVDTSDEVLKQRLASYHESIAPILQIYKLQGILVDIDANGSIEEVQERMWNAIGKFLDQMPTDSVGNLI